MISVCVCVGGEGKVGKVVDIRGWDNESGRSVASVTWSNGTTNVYRMGHKGKVDLKYVSDGQGGFYYKDHLPKLGKRFSFINEHSFKNITESVLFVLCGNKNVSIVRITVSYATTHFQFVNADTLFCRRARRAAAPGER